VTLTLRAATAADVVSATTASPTSSDPTFTKEPPYLRAFPPTRRTRLNAETSAFATGRGSELDSEGGTGRALHGVFPFPREDWVRGLGLILAAAVQNGSRFLSEGTPELAASFEKPHRVVHTRLSAFGSNSSSSSRAICRSRSVTSRLRRGVREWVRTRRAPPALQCVEGVADDNSPSACRMVSHQIGLVGIGSR
jgi:hypothetical protein